MYRTFTDPELLRGLSHRGVVVNNIVRYLDCPLFDISFHATLMMFVFILYARRRVRIPWRDWLRRTIFLFIIKILSIYLDSFLLIAHNKSSLKRKKELFMIVTATEFKTNFDKYLELAAKEDIFITRNGKTVAKVINPQISAVDSLRGMLKDVPSDIELDSLREERLSKYEDHV